MSIHEMLSWCNDSQHASHSDIKAKASGLKRKMNTFKFVYGLHLLMLVLNHLENLSATLRTPDICAADAQKFASLVIETLQKLRTNEQAQLFYDSVK